MANELQKSNTGKAGARIAEGGWNRVVDGVRHVESLMGGRRGPGSVTSSPPLTTIVTVRNDSGADGPRGSILGIHDILFDPGTDASEIAYFRTNFAFKVVAPTRALHRDSFCVLLDAIPKDKIGRAAIAGAVAVKIAVSDANHYSARITDSDATKLTSCPGGGIPILWKQSGTGDKLAVIQLGSPVWVEPCRVKQNGGSAGSDTTTCTYTYDVYLLDNSTKVNTSGGAITPKNVRVPHVAYMAATYGHYFIDQDGSYALFLWNEAPGAGDCED